MTQENTLRIGAELLRDENGDALLFVASNCRPPVIYENGSWQGFGYIGLWDDLFATYQRKIAAPPRDLERFRVYARAWYLDIMRRHNAEARKRAHD